MGAVSHVFDLFREMRIFQQMLSSFEATSYGLPALKILDSEYYIWQLCEVKRSIFFWKTKTYSTVCLREPRPPPNAKFLFKTNATELLENAASLIQYKLSVRRDFPTWIEFNRWTKRNSAYTRIIDAVREYLRNDDLTVRIFLPLVQVAFETNRPVQAFGLLLSNLKIGIDGGGLRNIISKPEPCRWMEIFDKYLNKSPRERPEYGDFLSKKFFRLDRFTTSDFKIGGKIRHPIIGYYTRLWGLLEKRENLAYRYAFTAPNRYATKINSLEGILNGPLTLLKFSVKGQNVVLVTGDLNKTGLADSLTVIDGKTVKFDASMVKSTLVDFLVIFGTARRFAGALMDSDFRLCHHQSCPHFKDNYCNSWIFVPENHESCTFPKRLKSLQDSLSKGLDTASKFKTGVFVGGNSSDIYNVDRYDV